LLLLAFAIFASSEHCQAAERAAADIEGHPAAAEHGEPRRLSVSVNVRASEMKETAN
jgi:hypothetical protein